MKKLIISLCLSNLFLLTSYAQGQQLPAGYSAVFAGVNTKVSSLAGYADVHVGYSFKGNFDIGASYQVKGMTDINVNMNAVSGFLNVHILRQEFRSPLNMSIGAEYSNMLNANQELSRSPINSGLNHLNLNASVSRALGGESFFFIMPTLRVSFTKATNPFSPTYTHKSLSNNFSQMNYELEFSVPIIMSGISKQFSLEPIINRSQLGMTYGVSANFFILQESKACVRKRRLKSRGRNW